MSDQNITIHEFTNGLTLVTEAMLDVQSAAFSMLVPGGAIFDPDGGNGTAAILSDLITRGAGDRDSRRLSESLDNLGLQRHESVGSVHLSFSGATVAENLSEALRIYADVIRRPRLPADQFEAARAGVEQSLRAIEDEPRQKIMQRLRRHCYPDPWGRSVDGSLEELPAITADSVRHHYETCLRPNGAILGVAGRIDAAAITDLVGDLFGDWERQPERNVADGPQGESRSHIEHDSTQTHIGLAFPTVVYSDPDYYAAWAAVSLLSGGMSARLFTEVREKRGLCYAISASLHALKEHARVLGYAGTTNERAQHTLDAMLLSILWLANGIADDELKRCKARAKSSLIMQQESTIARAGAVARDWFHLGRVTTLDEVREKIEALTVDSVLAYVHAHPPRELTILTIGPKPLEVPR
ncbi:MAG: M16 family metallopeptidase [Planctomycetaceae bacterium]